MDIESHDYIIITIIAGIIIFQVWVFVVNIRKIGDYKKTIKQAKNFEIIEVEVPEEWIKEIEVKEILGNPAAFRELSANFTKQGSDEVSDKNNSSNDISENTESENFINKNAPPNNSSVQVEPIPEELDFPEEEFEPEPEPEIEEYEEDDFEFEEEDYKVKGKSNR